MKYSAEVITLLNRYIEVKVIDDYDDFWVGIVFGITVKGTGGTGNIRGCRVTRIDKENIIAEGISFAGNPIWKSLEEKVNEILSNN